MPRFARTVAVGCAHHIVQRGNNQQKAFFVDDDRRVYLKLVADAYIGPDPDRDRGEQSPGRASASLIRRR